MCCVAIARRKYLRCNISAFSKYEVCSCITGQRSENRTPWSEQIICAPVQQKMFCSYRFRFARGSKKQNRRKKTGPKPYATHVDALKNDDFRLIHTLRFREF